ncbi:MAG: zinc ribbon domain-containing protein [Chloroflexi bacterium]|nr:zinc ribbon domain-containing protein [Chloroflexota bacterium]
MPVYEYHCLRCGHRFELRRRLSEVDDETACPKCGSKSPRRVFSSFATGSSSSGSAGTCAPSGST